MDRLAATGRLGPYEKEYLLKNGSRRWMLFAGREPWRDGTKAALVRTMRRARRLIQASSS